MARARAARLLGSALEPTAPVEVLALLDRGDLGRGDLRRGRPQRRRAVGEHRDRVGDGVAHLSQRLQRQIVDVVAGLVVAGVVGDARPTAVGSGLGRGLDPLGAGEQAARRNADVDERAIVGAAVEGGRRRGEAAVREEALEHPLDQIRAGRAGSSGPPAYPSRRRRRRTARSSARPACRS